MPGDEKRLREGRNLKRGVFLGCALLCAALAGAQTPDARPEPAAQDAKPLLGAAEAATHDAELITEPPGAQSEIPHISDATWSVWDDLWPSDLLRDVRLTDLLIVLFAAVVALFAARIGTVTAGIRAAARRQADEGRRVTDASEKAASAARRSADAVEKILADMRETADRQLRAYVTVRQFTQTPVKDERQGGQGWLVQVAWQNSGATPTKGFRYWAMLREFERGIPEDFPFTPAGLKDFAGGELGSNSSVNTPSLFVSPQLIARIQDGSRKVLLLGQADYGDVLAADAKRETRFCVEVVLVGDPGGSNPPFSFAYHPKHNYIT